MQISSTMYMHFMYKRIIYNRVITEKRATKNKTIKLRWLYADKMLTEWVCLISNLQGIKNNPNETV